MTLFNSRLIVSKIAVCLVCCMSIYAHAADITMNFSGTIKSGSCSVTTPTLNVDLGDVGTQSFDSEGGVSRQLKLIPISLDCPDGGPDSATITFSGTPSSDPTLLALDKDSDSASGVAIRIADRIGTKVNLGEPSETHLDAGMNSILYNAQYESLGNRSQIVAGKANATAEFTINYP
ncbi:fimbrial protein [Rahnella victoriana]|uniref:fimbrial protein n=1 Tax=Rahnella victoriana TaxID=1510570 RepID=UPI001E65721E|nr:fimbrial protein [Rahnella victoriana]UHM93644.1 type 1 fimbrial protein [Rahnella victoriana]